MTSSSRAAQAISIQWLFAISVLTCFAFCDQIEVAYIGSEETRGKVCSSRPMIRLRSWIGDPHPFASPLGPSTSAECEKSICIEMLLCMLGTCTPGRPAGSAALLTLVAKVTPEIASGYKNSLHADTMET